MRPKPSHPHALGFAFRFFLFSIVLLAASCLLLLLSRGIRDLSPIPVSEEAPAPPESLCVVIDAGHGGEDGGAIGQNGVLEKTLNLQLAERLADLLATNGVKVIMTRREDVMLYDRSVDYRGQKKMLDLAARLRIARENENDLFVSIHMNAYPEERYHGLQVYYSPHDPRSQAAADTIQEAVQAHLQPDNQRRIKEATSAIYLLKHLETPAILIECGFISNRRECELLCEEGYAQRLALVIADSILQHLSQGSS